MKLRKEDQEFRNPKVFYPDAKNVDLDRVLVNLFLLLRCGGARLVTKGRPRSSIAEVQHHAKQLAKMPENKGFDQHEEIAASWLRSDVFDVVHRGTAHEAVASLRPLHLDAYRIRVAKNCRDYNVSDWIYAMLEHGERQALDALKAYLDAGRDPHTKQYDGKAPLDLETLAVLKLVEDLDPAFTTGESAVKEPPVCIGQARVLAEDVQCLLAYREAVPRSVMIDYLKTIMGLHAAQYMLRLSKQLTGWIADQRANPVCLNCPVNREDRGTTPFAQCPYGLSFVVDMGGDYRSRMAQVAQASAAAAYGTLPDLVKAVFTMNQLLRYARENKGLGIPEDPTRVLELLPTRTAEFEAWYNVRLSQIKGENENKTGEGEGKQAEDGLFDLPLPPFEKFIELVTHVRWRFHRTYLTQLLDRLLQKNGEYGALAQGKARANSRRWHLGGRLLEVFVQLAVLRWDESGGAKQFRSEPILIDDFLRWLEGRYGFVIGGATLPGGPRPVTADEQAAFRANVRMLKDQLREIGFFDDLSDAYNAQTIRPRYAIHKSVDS